MLKNEVSELKVKTTTLKAEVKASKRNMKFNAVKLSQIAQNKQDLVQMSAIFDLERSNAIKGSAAMPALHLSPFLPISNQIPNDSVGNSIFELANGEEEDFTV